MSGAMLVFPELEASAYCGHCLQPSFACSGGLGCSGSGEDLVLLGCVDICTASFPALCPRLARLQPKKHFA